MREVHHASCDLSYVGRIAPTKPGRGVVVVDPEPSATKLETEDLRDLR